MSLDKRRAHSAHVDQEHSDFARAQNQECGTFYMDSRTRQSYPCSCGFAERDKKLVKLTTDRWEEQYNPLDSPAGNLVWEHTDLRDHDIPENRTWTLVEGDGDHIYALPGYHYVNRIGYAVTEHPWEHRNIEARYDHDGDE